MFLYYTIFIGTGTSVPAPSLVILLWPPFFLPSSQATRNMLLPVSLLLFPLVDSKTITYIHVPHKTGLSFLLSQKSAEKIWTSFGVHSSFLMRLIWHLPYSAADFYPPLLEAVSHSITTFMIISYWSIFLKFWMSLYQLSFFWAADKWIRKLCSVWVT